MLGTRLLATLHVLLGVIVLVGPARSQGVDARTTVSEIPLPGGLRAALAATGDRAAPDRSQFLLEFIKRTYDVGIGAKNDSREAALGPLLAALDHPADLSSAASADRLPLPLSPQFWIAAVFEGRATPDTLVASIVRSRAAALLYDGLLSLDDETRAWSEGQPRLFGEIVSRYPAAFAAAAPGLRIAGGTVRVPGGAAAAPAWRALVGRRVDEPANFVRSLLDSGEGRLAFFFGAMGQLTPVQISVALNLDAPDPAARVDAARRLYEVFQRIGAGRAIEQRAYVRPTYDPSLLIAELRTKPDGRPVVPGSRAFWAAAFAEGDATAAKAAREASAAAGRTDQPPEFSWLCEQVFKGEPAGQRGRYMMVLFASRRLGPPAPDNANDAVAVVRAVATYPALITVLERAGITDIPTYASAVRRAAALSSIADEGRGVRAMAQFQGALALVARAASRGSLTASGVSRLVASLSTIDVSERGDYEGRLVPWLNGWLGPLSSTEQVRDASPTEGTAEEIYQTAAGPLEQAAWRVLSGPATAPRFVDWEGTRYRLDFPRAAAVRLVKALGESPRPYLSMARAAVAVADALEAPGVTREGLREQANAFPRIAATEADDGPADDLAGRRREVSTALEHAARAGDIRAAARVAQPIRLLADDLLGRGLMELAYATALGQGEGVPITAGDAARRHEFGLRSGQMLTSAAWRLPLPGTDAAQRWRVYGSVLGLEVGLAPFALVSLSSKPPPRRPTVNEVDRRVFIEAVALVEPAALTDDDRDSIVAAMRKGRARLDAVRTPADAHAVADDLHLGAARRTLLAWMAAHEAERTSAFLSPSELLWLGLEPEKIGALDAWGAPGVSRAGCLCLQVMDRRPWETFSGRWTTGLMASAFPDLNFRLAELLAELQMPAALLAPVLTSSTLDFINNASCRGPDDHRGLVEFVQSLRAERMEQYLALLTTDGPLVPIGETPRRPQPPVERPAR